MADGQVGVKEKNVGLRPIASLREAMGAADDDHSCNPFSVTAERLNAAAMVGEEPRVDLTSSLGFDPEPTVHDLRHSWFTNAVRSKVYPYITDAIPGHGDQKKSLQALYLTISDEDLLAAIDMMKFDGAETDIRVKR